MIVRLSHYLLSGLIVAAMTHGVRADSVAPLRFEPGDRVLFVGDEMTQQMFYTRAVAAALLPLHADKQLRFFNGGRAGATAEQAGDWIDELVGLVQPTVVTVCFGLNEATSDRDPSRIIADYTSSMDALLKRLNDYRMVRQVVVIGPPPIQLGLNHQLHRGEPNHTLLVLSHVGRQMSQIHGAVFVDLFEHLSAVYLGQMQVGGEPLTIGGHLPNEQGHMVIASVVLRDLGLTSGQLNDIGWSPLIPIKMRRVRQVLAIPTQAPSPQAAARSRALYQALTKFDEQFFRIWRLSSRRRQHRTGHDPRHAAQTAWQAVMRTARGNP